MSTKSIGKCSLTVSSFYIASAPATLMEVVKAIARQEPAVHENVAIRADQKSYSYKELLSSAQQISNLLCAASDALEVSYPLQFPCYSVARTKPSQGKLRKSLKVGGIMFSIRKQFFYSIQIC